MLQYNDSNGAIFWVYSSLNHFFFFLTVTNLQGLRCCYCWCGKNFVKAQHGEFCLFVYTIRFIISFFLDQKYYCNVRTTTTTTLSANEYLYNTIYNLQINYIIYNRDNMVFSTCMAPSALQVNCFVSWWETIWWFIWFFDRLWSKLMSWETRFLFFILNFFFIFIFVDNIYIWNWIFNFIPNEHTK